MTETKKKIRISIHNYQLTKMLEEEGYEVSTGESNPDLLLLPGGADIAPSLYFQTAAPQTNAIDKDRDFNEMSLITAARLSGIPVVGVCRGMQLLHISLGGSLIQHIDNHRYSPHYVTHPENFSQIRVNSAHHQAVPYTEKGFYEEVWMSNADPANHETTEIVEAFYDGRKKIFGIQWHPEYHLAPDGCIKFFFDGINKLLKG
jgi:putative glutamine amidotransferase